MPEEAELLKRIKAGDRSASDRLVQMYYKDIFRMSYRFTGNVEDAEEVTQQTFCKAFDNIGSMRGDSQIKTWLFRIALNENKTFYRKKKDHLELDPATVSSEGAEEGILKKVINKETLDIAMKAVKELPPKQRDAVILRVINELDYAEIGRITNCSESTAKVNFHYGIENLRKKMNKNGVL